MRCRLSAARVKLPWSATAQAAWFYTDIEDQIARAAERGEAWVDDPHAMQALRRRRVELTDPAMTARVVRAWLKE